MSLIEFPDISPKRSSFRCVYAISESESPFSLNTQIYDWGGARFEGEMTLDATSYDEACELKAFLSNAKGKANKFLYGDPEYLVRGARGSKLGTPVVDGAAQVGDILNVRGFDNSEINLLKKGDYIQLGLESAAKLYQVTEDVSSNASGKASIKLNRSLLDSPADDESVIINNAKSVFRLAENNIEWSANPTGISSITIPIKEAL